MRSRRSAGGSRPAFALTVRADSAWRGAAELRGARVGVTTLTSLTAWLTRQVSRLQGWGEDGITLVPAGAGNVAWALLRTGQVDAVAGDMGSALQAEARGDGRVVVRFGEVIRQFQTFVIYAPDAVLAARPEAVRAFLAGWFETVALAAAEPARLAPVMAELLGLDPGVTARLYAALMPMFSRDGRFLPENMRALDAALREQYGVGVDPTSVTEAYLPR